MVIETNAQFDVCFISVNNKYIDMKCVPYTWWIILI